MKSISGGFSLAEVGALTQLNGRQERILACKQTFGNYPQSSLLEQLDDKNQEDSWLTQVHIVFTFCLISLSFLSYSGLDYIPRGFLR